MGSIRLLKSCIDLIIKDDLLSAFEKIENTESSEFDLKCATKCLLQLQVLLSQSLKKGREVNSSTCDIYRLAMKCLETIELNLWEIDNVSFFTCVYYLSKFFLKQDELSFARSICLSLHRSLSQGGSIPTNDNEKAILKQIRQLFISYLYSNIDLTKYVNGNSEDLSLIFVCWQDLHDLDKCNQDFLRSSLYTIRLLVQKIKSLKLTLNESIHIESIRYVMVHCVEFGCQIQEVSEAFEAYIETLITFIGLIVDTKLYQELNYILDLLVISKKVFLHKDCLSCLDFCTNLIRLAAIDTNILEGDCNHLCNNARMLLEELSSNEFKFMSSMIDLLWTTLSGFPFEFKTDVTAHHRFNLIFSAFEGQKGLANSSNVTKMETEDVTNFISLLSLIVSKTVNLPREFNRADVLISSFDSLKKAMDYTIDLSSYVYNNEYSFKKNYESLVGKFSNVIYVYYSTDLFDDAMILALNLLERLACLPSETLSSISAKLDVSYIFAILSHCSQKTAKFEGYVIAILAWICKDMQGYASADKLFERLAALKNCGEYFAEEKSSTFFELLERKKKLLVHRWNVPLTAMSDIKCPSIILSEMRAYCKVQPPQVEILLKCLKNLLNSNPTLFEAAKGILLVLDLATKTHVDVDKIDKERLKIQKNLFKKVKESNDFESLLALGNLLHYDSLFKIYAIRKEIQIQTGKWKALKTHQTLDETGLFTDPHDSCGPIATSALAFSSQQPLLEELDKSCNYLKSALTKITCDCNDMDFYLEISHSNLKASAQLYSLYHHEEKAIGAWMLLYSIGKKFSHQTMCISAVTNLLKLQTQVDRSWIENALEVANTLPENSSVRQLFFICLASNCIKSSQIPDAVSHLNNVGSEFRSQTTYIYFLLTLGQVLFHPESGILWKGTPTSAIYACEKAFRYLYHFINEGGWDGFLEHLELEEFFLESLMCLKRFFSSIMMPRLAYFYMNEQTALVQKLAVPIRTAQLLVALAWVDVSVYKQEDCDLKLANIMSILGIEKKTHKIKSTALSPSMKGLTISGEVAGVCSSLSDVMRESCSTSKPCSSAPNGSPTLHKEEWSEIVLHSHACSCLSCQTPSFMCLTFDVIVLQAASYCIRKQFSQAVKFFDDGVKFLEHLEGKGIDQDWIRGRQTMLNYFYAEMLVSHKNFNAAFSFVRKTYKHGSGTLPTETYGVTADHITLQLDNLLFYKLKNRLKKVTKSKPISKGLLSVPLPGAGLIRTPAKTSVVPNHLLLGSTSSTANLMISTCDRRNKQVFAKALQFSSDEEDDVVNETLAEKENNFSSPNLLKKQKPGRKQVPAIVTKIPSVMNKPSANDSVKNKKPKAEFKICKDPPANSSKKATSSVDDTQNSKLAKTKRPSRAVDRK